MYVLKFVNLYFSKYSERQSEKYKMWCMNIHLTVYLFTFNKLSPFGTMVVL